MAPGEKGGDVSEGRVPVAARYRRAAWWHRFVAAANIATTAALVLASSVLLAVLVGELDGYRFLTIRSGSMTPTIPVGALVVSERVPPASVAPGTIVTFRDRTRHGELVTHRVVHMVVAGRMVHFTTKGDANSGTESWTVPRTGSIGRTVVVVPDVGRVLAVAASPGARLVGIGVLSTWVLALGLRRIWRTPRLATGSEGDAYWVPYRVLGRPGDVVLVSLAAAPPATAPVRTVR